MLTRKQITKVRKMINQTDMSGTTDHRPQVRPLRAKTMTLDDLQRQILLVLRMVRQQFNRPAWKEGMTDSEFLDRVVGRLETVIKQDRMVSKINSSKEKKHALPKRTRSKKR